MEIEPILFWNGILTLIIGPAVFAWRSMSNELRRLDTLLHMTREQYSRKDEVKEDVDRVMLAIHRLEDKIDKMREQLDK